MDIVENMPFKDYLAVDAASKHGLELLLRSPAHYRYSLGNPRPSTAAQELGRLAHAVILEPHTVDRSFACEKIDRRTAAGKARALEIEERGLTVVSEEQMEMAYGMRDAVMDNPVARILLSSGKAEMSLFWTDEETGLPCKARPDWWNEDHQVLVDLKTANDASEDAFSRAAGSYSYHMQDAHYTAGASSCGLSPVAFLFLVVESSPPHQTAIYVLDETAKHAGAVKIARALTLLAECKRTDSYPGYPQGIQTLELKPWSL